MVKKNVKQLVQNIYLTCNRLATVKQKNKVVRQRERQSGPNQETFINQREQPQTTGSIHLDHN